MEHTLSDRPEPALGTRRETKDQVYSAGAAAAQARLRGIASGKRVGDWERPELQVRPEDIGTRIDCDRANLMALCRDSGLLVQALRQPMAHPVTETIIADAEASMERIQRELGAVQR